MAFKKKLHTVTFYFYKSPGRPELQDIVHLIKGECGRAGAIVGRRCSSVLCKEGKHCQPDFTNVVATVS